MILRPFKSSFIPNLYDKAIKMMEDRGTTFIREELRPGHTVTYELIKSAESQGNSGRWFAKEPKKLQIEGDNKPEQALALLEQTSDEPKKILKVTRSRHYANKDTGNRFRIPHPELPGFSDRVFDGGVQDTPRLLIKPLSNQPRMWSEVREAIKTSGEPLLSGTTLNILRNWVTKTGARNDANIAWRHPNIFPDGSNQLFLKENVFNQPFFVRGTENSLITDGKQVLQRKTSV